MKIKFREIKLSQENQTMLGRINSIVQEYQQRGLLMSLRQLYYQLVSRNIIRNHISEYAKLSKLLKEGRMAGIVDWAAIEDRLRTAESPASWESPLKAMEALIAQYERPRMEGQSNYLEVWVEKDALSGVLSVVTEKYHVPILVNRGYSSVSAIFDSYKRFRAAMEAGQTVTILYLGDFDPSGMDMIRDVTERPLEMLLAKDTFIDEQYDKWVEEVHSGDLGDAFIELEQTFGRDEDCYIDEHIGPRKKDVLQQFVTQKAFIKSRFNVVSIALTKEQIAEHKPPPNPAKKTDPRSRKFIKKHGSQSWEVDALNPDVLNDLLELHITSRLDMKLYEQQLRREKDDIKSLKSVKTYL